MFTITIYDKDFNRVGWLGDPKSVEVVQKHNSVGYGKIVIPLNHPKFGLLWAEGARCVFHRDGEQVLSGFVGPANLEGPSQTGDAEFTVDDDLKLLDDTLGWQNPLAAVTSQTDDTYVITGPAETVVKDLVSKNHTRLGGVPVTVAPDLGRGATVTVAVRMQKLGDVLLKAVDAAGIGVSIMQSGSGLVVDCYEPDPYPLELSEASGVITNWNLQRTALTATNVVVGGQGEGNTRVFALYKDDARAALWGRRVEVFTDAKADTDGDVFAQAGAEKLAEGDVLPGLNVTLSETENFRYGAEGVRVGSMVRLRLTPGVVVEDLLRSVTMRWTPDDGFEATPTVGFDPSPEHKLAEGLGSLARSLRNVRSR